MPPIDPDETPEAAQPSPPLTLYLRVTENDAAQDFDGGRVVLRAIKNGAPTDMNDGAFILSARTDAFLVQYPWKTRAAKQGRFYRLTLEEIEASALPPDPDVAREIALAEKRLEALKAGASA